MSFFGKTTAATATNARSSSSSSTTATASATAPATATDMNDVKTDLTPNGVPLLIKFAMDFGRDDVPYKPAREVTVEILKIIPKSKGSCYWLSIVDGSGKINDSVIAAAYLANYIRRVTVSRLALKRLFMTVEELYLKCLTVKRKRSRAGRATLASSSTRRDGCPVDEETRNFIVITKARMRVMEMDDQRRFSEDSTELTCAPPSKISFMPIKSLRPSMEGGWTIKGRVSRKSKKKQYFKRGVPQVLFNFNIRDASGEIRFVVFDRHFKEWFEDVEENELYAISMGKVVESNDSYPSSANHEFEIIVVDDTTITRLS